MTKKLQTQEIVGEAFIYYNDTQSHNTQLMPTLMDKVEKSKFEFHQKMAWALVLWSIAIQVVTGNSISGPLFSPFSSFSTSPSQPLLIVQLLGSKNLFIESWREHPKI